MKQKLNLVCIFAIVFSLLLTTCAGHPGLFPPFDAQLYFKPPANAITFWGRATCYIDINGTGIVTDPVFVKSLPLWHFRKIPAPPPSAYRNAEIILISHAHRDHLNPKTLSQFPKTATVLCSEPSAKIVKELGMRVQVMNPEDSFVFHNVSIVAVPAYHPGGRNSLKARADGRALGFIIRTPGRILYYSGDTEYFSGLKDIGKEYRPEVALLNISVHLTPMDAVRAFRALGVSKVIPMHFGAYGGPTAAKYIRFSEELKEMLGTLCALLRVGESYQFSLRESDSLSLSTDQNSDRNTRYSPFCRYISEKSRK